MMFGEVPISVIKPPTSAQNDIGIRTRWAPVLCRRASCIATGIRIASAPIFFITADISATVPPNTAIWRTGVFNEAANGAISTSATPGTRDPGADDESRADNDDDIVGEPRERLLGRDKPDHDAGNQTQQRHDVVAQLVPDEQRHHGPDQGEGECLLMCHKGLSAPLGMRRCATR